MAMSRRSDNTAKRNGNKQVEKTKGKTNKVTDIQKYNLFAKAIMAPYPKDGNPFWSGKQDGKSPPRQSIRLR